jgi:hypothetical protein
MGSNIGTVITSFLKAAKRNPKTTLATLAGGDIALNDAEGLKSAFTAVVTQGAEAIGIPTEYAKYAAPIAAAAGLGFLGKALAGNTMGLLAAAVPLVMSTLSYINGAQPATVTASQTPDVPPSPLG